jgi:hypothetical protein
MVAERDSETAAEQAPADGDHRGAADQATVADQSSDAAPQDTASAHPAGEPAPDEPDQAGDTDEIPEVGGVPYATGPRLRRVRSLPVPPADDDE